MNNFTCTFLQYITWGVICLTGGLRLGLMFGRNSRDEEVEYLRDEIIKLEIELEARGEKNDT